ncbi:hypothetical protein SAMN06265379_1211 [Saccharicrinis carchari]|uniref:Uncharacterized protein n=1 Tax=Saccharicrinis carchari TaxID=1168039 RepID=A0A521FC14_SACCC|nr:hypothetical protein SAMN06265379_1211 [Saccharicrinis carchari]
MTFISCDQLHVLNTIYIYEGHISTSNDTINMPLERVINGDYIFEVNKEILKSGNLTNSCNDGVWEYHIVEKNSTLDSIVHWSLKATEELSYSIPETWKLIQISDTIKIIAIDLKPEFNRSSLDNNYLVVQKIRKEGKSLKSFNSFNTQSIQGLFKIKAHDYCKVELNDSICGYYNRYVTLNETQILNYNFETLNAVYELTVSVRASTPILSDTF